MGVACWRVPQESRSKATTHLLLQASLAGRLPSSGHGQQGLVARALAGVFPLQVSCMCEVLALRLFQARSSLGGFYCKGHQNCSLLSFPVKPHVVGCVLLGSSHAC